MSDKNAHIVIDTKTSEFWCKNCSTRYLPNLPCSIEMYVQMLKSFGKDHRRCKK